MNTNFDSTVASNLRYLSINEIAISFDGKTLKELIQIQEQLTSQMKFAEREEYVLNNF